MPSYRGVGWRALLILGLTLAAYAPALRAGFIWDDERYVTKNPMLQDARGLRRIWFDTSATVQYYPLTHTTFWLERHVWGVRPFGYHLVNVLLHAGSAVLLALVLKALRVPGAWLAAAVFALHPVHVESVAWVTERKNVLSAFLMLGAALAYLGSARLGIVSLVLFCAALLAKTAVAPFPIALAILLYWRRGRFEMRDGVYLTAMALCAAALAPVTAWLEVHQVGAQGSEWSHSIADRAIVAGRAFWFYLGKLAWPHPLSFTYPRWTLVASSASSYVAPVAVVALFAALGTRRARWTAGPLVAAACFLLMLAPALGFSNVFPMRYSYVADHFQYVASLAAIALAAALLTEGWSALARRRPEAPIRHAGPVAGGLLLAVLLELTSNRAQAFHDDETLWRDTLAKNPDAFMAHNNLAVIAVGRGDLLEATEHFERSFRLKPDYASALNLGLALERQGHTERAVALYRESLRLKPDEIGTHLVLGEALQGRGERAEARELFEAAVRLGPRDPRALSALASLFLDDGRPHEAAAYYARVVAVLPANAIARLNLGIALARDGRDAEALDQLRAGLRLAPDDPDIRSNLDALLLRIANKDVAVKAP